MITTATDTSAQGIERASAARVGMIGLIVAEASLFAVFVVAYLYDLGKSLSGPSPKEVLSVPVLGTVCLLSSSVTVALAVRAFGRGAVRRCGAWLLATVVLAVVFLTGTAAEWLRLITREGVTIGTNLFGTTFYALVGLHASHVIVGVVMLTLIGVFAWSRALQSAHVERVELVSWYWHLVDAVWVVVLTVVYVIGR
ncbi:MAG: heme-copper oxidase subunit III [Candidatus Rokubacteria bacterium 13_1_20CM_4_68_9]|nr:MAG: heme-copper oxidase subunit III [Candidatus Rokubacteria bacterium 13_1_20CM_4_68_9]